MSKARPITFRQFITVVLICCFSAAYLLLHARVLQRIGDEGILVYGAQLVSQGALPYRDFFEPMGPGSFYWLALFYKLFGTNILVTRSALLLTATLTILLLYWMTQRVYQGPFEIFPSIFYLITCFPMCMGTSHHWDSNLFALLAVAAFCLWQDRGRWWFLVLTGGLAGLTSCFMQQKGLFVIVGLCMVALWNGYRVGETKSTILSNLGIMLSSFIMIGGLVLLFFYLSRGLPDLIYANLTWPFSQYHNVNRVPYGFGISTLHYGFFRQILQGAFPASTSLSLSLSLLLMIPLGLVVCLPFCLLGLGGYSCLTVANRSKIFSNAMLPYWAAGLALWISEFHRPDTMHLVFGSPLLLILFFVVCGYYLKNKKLLESGVVWLILSCLILLSSFNSNVALSAKQEIVSRRGTIFGFKEDKALNFLIEHTNPGDFTFIYPYYPMYYFLADVKNPTRYSVLVYRMNTRAQFDDVIQNLEQKKVKYVLWDTLVTNSTLKRWLPQYDPLPEKDLVLEQYFEDFYEDIGMANGFRILLRQEEKQTN